MFSGWIGRDDGFGAARGEPIAQGFGVIGAVGEKPPGRARDRKKRAGADEIMGVAGRERERDGPSFVVRQGVDFSRPPAARGANGVIKSPPFAPAAERCALTCVESIAPVTTPVEPVRA